MGVNQKKLMARSSMKNNRKKKK